MQKAKTRQEIANEYGVDRKTLYRWLKRENIEISKGLVTPKEQKLIYDRLGKPEASE